MIIVKSRLVTSFILFIVCSLYVGKHLISAKTALVWSYHIAQLLSSRQSQFLSHLIILHGESFWLVDHEEAFVNTVSTVFDGMSTRGAYLILGPRGRRSFERGCSFNIFQET